MTIGKVGKEDNPYPRVDRLLDHFTDDVKLNFPALQSDWANTHEPIILDYVRPSTTSTSCCKNV